MKNCKLDKIAQAQNKINNNITQVRKLIKDGMTLSQVSKTYGLSYGLLKKNLGMKNKNG